jgi:hypothetical protein
VSEYCQEPIGKINGSGGIEPALSKNSIKARIGVQEAILLRKVVEEQSDVCELGE